MKKGFIWNLLELNIASQNLVQSDKAAILAAANLGDHEASLVGPAEEPTHLPNVNCPASQQTNEYVNGPARYCPLGQLPTPWYADMIATEQNHLADVRCHRPGERYE